MWQVGAIVWERRFDHVGHRGRTREFWMYIALPAAVLVVMVGIFVGIGEAARVRILLGLLGGMGFLWMWLTGQSAR